MQKFLAILVGSALALLIQACRTPTPAQEDRLTPFVDPFIGTAGHGHTYPGAAYPFGQIQLSPDNVTDGWDPPRRLFSTRRFITQCSSRCCSPI
jgi:putative alpha-1,2-mannosidase